MYHFNLVVAKDPAEVGKLAADQFEAVLKTKPACVIGLATGSTPLPLYNELIKREKEGKISFERVRSANLDEYKGLAPDHPQSYRRFIGFNEPDDHFPGMTHEVKLTAMTREANKRFFDSIDEVPTAAFTMGIGTVMAARKIVMVVTGADKAGILNASFFGPVTPQGPASILQFHPDVTVICDEAAASKIAK